MRGDGGFGRDSGTPKRRMLPAVTDVVRELARTVPADPAVLFKAARQAVADELAKVKQGFESAPLDVLVRRARRQLENEGVASPVPEGGEREEARSVSIPAAPRPKKTAGTAGAGGEDPFQSAGVADLDWEKRLDIQPDDAPFRSAILPLPPRSRAPQEIAPPEKTAVPAPAAPRAPSPPSSSRLPLPDRVVAPQGLSVERSGAALRPKPPVDDLPLFSSPTLELSSPVAPAPPPPDLFAPEPLEPLQPLQPEPSAPPAPEEPVAAEVRVAPIAPPLDQHPFEVPAFDAPEPPPPSLAAQEPDFERPDPWLVEPEPPAIRPPEARIEIDTPPPPSQPAPRPEPAVRSMSEMPPLAHLVGDVTEPVEPAMEEFAFKAPETPAARKKSGRNGWIAAVLVVLAVAAGLLWAVRTFLSGDLVRKVEAPLPAPKKAAPAPAPAAVPVPAPAPPAAAAANPAAKPAAKPAVPAPQQTAFPKAKAAPLVTPDWSGKPVVYVVHFSSHKDRPSAEKEAKRLAGDLGRTARAVEVDLGPKGVWYRVVAGEFATVEDARAYRADLEAKKTPGLGFVYEMHGR